jgi:4-aminobutyrate aminotransferase-like enzyme/Ser/Thr protein kinase RdoA (MazF antagonist)
MSPDYTPRFSAAEASRAAHEFFRIAGATSVLASERDQNFALVTDHGEKYVLKIAKADEDAAVLNFQNAALRHLHERVATLRLPRVLPSKQDKDVAVIRDSKGTAYLARLVTWLEGGLFAQVARHDAKLLASLGRAVAELDEGLEGFSHPVMHRELYWDLKHIDLALKHLPLLSGEQREVIAHFRDKWERVRWEDLRQSVIHGDINDHNVVVRNGRVSGFIDFGDMVQSALVCDLAIAMAYAMLDQANPLAAAATITGAFHERYALTAAEVEALFPLVTCRLSMTLCYAAYNALAKSGDAYQTIHADSAWKLLATLRGIPFERAQVAIREACGGPAQVLAARRRLFGGNLSLSYDQPLNIVRGSMQYLYDENGRQFLDAYNNVPHVGHCHPRVVEAGQAHMAVLNTNTRYLNGLVNTFAERLVATLPGPLKVCFFVNSGSEANELALRLARAHTGERNLIVLEQAYHGNTTTLIDISPYKHGSAGKKPAWVHVAELPDLYRGAYKRQDPDAGAKYAQSVVRIIESLRGKGQALSGFIAESWPSVGGQLDFPPGYLPNVYQAVRAAGGICIADEVQTGYGRLGKHFYGFEAYGVVPDIVVLGKPIGNGHPIGAVITTPDIAGSFDNGVEFFSTFGGNTVSCAIGLTVLKVVVEEKLQSHALEVGDYLLRGLGALATRHSLIGDVRGSGFFVGVELVRDRETLQPAANETSRIVNLMRSHGVLVGSEGAAHNVLKIRPPMLFNSGDADLLLATLDRALASL